MYKTIKTNSKEQERTPERPREEKISHHKMMKEEKMHKK
jgi:hypothetical protein